MQQSGLSGDLRLAAFRLDDLVNLALELAGLRFHCEKFMLQVEDFQENVNPPVAESVRGQRWGNKLTLQRRRGGTHQDSRGLRPLPPSDGGQASLTSTF